jgi:hypothetical protein
MSNAILAELRAFYKDYIDTFNSHDFSAIPKFFSFPWVMITEDAPPFEMKDEQTQQASFEKTETEIKARGWNRSGVDHLDVFATGVDTGLLISDFTRYRADNSIVESKRAYYIVQRKEGRWKIVTILQAPLPGHKGK